MAWIISGISQGAWTNGKRIRNIPALMQGCSAPSSRRAEGSMIAKQINSFVFP
jgi:hypothetical protein